MMKLILIVLFMMIIGIFLLVASSMITKAAANLPLENKVVKANQGIFTMGIVFIVCGLALIACTHKCNCGDMMLGSTAIMVFFILLGVTLTALGAIVRDSINVSSGKSWATYVMVTGIVFIVICSGLFWHEHGEKVKSGLGNLTKKNQPPAVAGGEPAVAEEKAAEVQAEEKAAVEEKAEPAAGGSMAFRYGRNMNRRNTFRCY